MEKTGGNREKSGQPDPWALMLTIVVIFRIKTGLLQTLAASAAAGTPLYAAGLISVGGAG